MPGMELGRSADWRRSEWQMGDSSKSFRGSATPGVRDGWKYFFYSSCFFRNHKTLILVVFNHTTSSASKRPQYSRSVFYLHFRNTLNWGRRRRHPACTRTCCCLPDKKLWWLVVHQWISFYWYNCQTQHRRTSNDYARHLLFFYSWRDSHKNAKRRSQLK